MKNIAVSLILSAYALIPAAGFAQTAAPITRAQVRADLARVEQAGYLPSRGANADYPADIQAAEAKIDADGTRQALAQGYGGASERGRSAAGTRAARTVAKGGSCVGPASFCNPYFGS
ncbi:hypothetical protein WJ41_18460 [Burkholderia ubonensis]|uniref:DUF4148 domain-containing protein n=1 Tax=Burkholderia ubonensis TaxID=101571 RepID=UPI0007589384|nr:DUF4148 domain-containing protein [Burkholderia ubonensis]KVH69821.1 hypothetical protein WJ41_18460 [Burkholderia ubonensis]KVU06877.1 hypothetical protein WK61_31010 [Burkholderia ubonensis]